MIPVSMIIPGGIIIILICMDKLIRWRCDIVCPWGYWNDTCEYDYPWWSCNDPSGDGFPWWIVEDYGDDEAAVVSYTHVSDTASKDVMN